MAPSSSRPRSGSPSFPLPVALHILGAATYVLLGALQFVPQFRRRHRTWHRRAGRILIVAGLLVAASALWMTLLYAAKPGTGDLLYVLRLVFGCALVACLVLGFAAIRRRNIPAHRAWMIRAYAIALAAGTQAFTQGIGGALLGTGELQGDLAQGAGWVINLAVAEWVIRRPARTRAPSATATPLVGPARAPQRQEHSHDDRPSGCRASPEVPRVVGTPLSVTSGTPTNRTYPPSHLIRCPPPPPRRTT